MLAIFVALFGLAVGSFINVVVWRLKDGESLTGRSHCRSCRRVLAWYHNLPVLSFLALRGRCAFCRAPISWQYPAVELSTAWLFWLGFVLGPSGDWLWLTTYLVIVSFAVALFVYDLKFQLLPDSLTLPAGLVVLGLNIGRGLSYQSLLLGIVSAAGFFALQWWFSRGRWIGAGDIRLGFFLGASLGWPLTVVALVLAYWVGAMVGLSLVLLGRRDFQSELPFGTFLTAALVATFLWGQGLLGWYLGRLGF